MEGCSTRAEFCQALQTHSSGSKLRVYAQVWRLAGRTTHRSAAMLAMIKPSGRQRTRPPARHDVEDAIRAQQQ